MRAKERDEVRHLFETGQRGRPAGDHRSAESIIDTSNAFRHFLEPFNASSFLIYRLKMQVSDWTDDNKDPESRADAAYNLEKVLRFIDNLDDRALTASVERSGVIEGFSDNGYYIADNSEARVLETFADEGYEALRNLY
ncbi:hypothetical protein CQZ99_12905 [Pseudomonas poae]|uniref:Uncharacterized protein n=2 Tax=Pseudomonas poae TaxID=200451 RepID=A0A2S9ET00_9PSED|nr:hypothetical protein CQZ97_03465 [Pseudomonas poae]PRC18840.1 hypothetical protein CQZ99_12905 [Pseudomonas poae]